MNKILLTMAYLALGGVCRTLLSEINLLLTFGHLSRGLALVF